MIRYIIPSSIVMVTLSIACLPVNKKSESKAIIGEDNRQEVQDKQLKATIGGLVSVDTNCTAFVTGADEVTTAAHCVDTGNLKN